MNQPQALFKQSPHASQTGWRWNLLMQTHLAMVGLLLLWFIPFLNAFWVAVDQQTFLWLNQSLLLSNAWLYFWGMMNHPNETWLNMVVMVVLNVYFIVSLPSFQRRRAFSEVLYFWLFFELILVAVNEIFSTGLQIERQSPSLVVEPAVWLSQALSNERIKDFSYYSFPAGHTLVAIYWACFALRHASKSWHVGLIHLTVMVLTFNRLFSGAHWLSDTLYTLSLGFIGYAWAIGTPLFTKANRVLDHGLAWLLGVFFQTQEQNPALTSEIEKE